MPIRRLLGRGPVVAIVTALALLAAGIAAVSLGGHHQQSSARAAAVMLSGARGLGLHIAQVKGVAGPPGPVTAMSEVYHVTPDGRLPRPVTIELPLRRAVPPDQDSQVFVFAKESLRGRWRPLRASIVAQGHYASVTVHRLSWLSAALVDPGKVLQVLEDFFKELTSGALNNATPPSCDQQAAALGDRYSYATSGSAMLACFGMASSGDHFVKLVDARRYPLLINTNMPEVSGGGGDIFQRIGQLLSPDGDVVYPQNEADLNATIPDDTSTVTLFARADVAQEGQLLSSLSVGIDALSTIIGAFGGKVAVSERVSIVKKMLEVQSCRDSADAEQLIANCLTLSELTGSFGDVLGAILAPVVTVSSLITYFRGALNGIFDQFDGRSRFVAAVQRAPSPFAVLKNVDWTNMSIPGSWFDGPAQVQLHADQYGEGIARNVPTRINVAQSNESEDVYLSAKPVYGYMRNVAVAAVRVDIQAAGSGTADGQRGSAYLVYKAGPNGPVYIGAATSQAAWPGAWAPDPTQADHTDLLSGASFQSGNLVIQEAFYGPTDFTAGPSGRATTSWSLSGDSLVTGQTVITQKASS